MDFLQKMSPKSKNKKKKKKKKKNKGNDSSSSEEEPVDPSSPKNVFMGVLAKVSPGTVAASQVLTPKLQARLKNPAIHAKVGRICIRMSAMKTGKNPAYSVEDIQDVIRALVPESKEEMRPAFDLFAGRDGRIDSEELKRTMPLLGEDLEEDEIKSLFSHADLDESGYIEFSEFCAMMFAISPKVKANGDGVTLLDAIVGLTDSHELIEASRLLLIDLEASKTDPKRNRERLKKLGLPENGDVKDAIDVASREELLTLTLIITLTLTLTLTLIAGLHVHREHCCGLA